MNNHYKNQSLENIEGEVWKDVIGWEACYKVSNYSRVKSLPRKVKKWDGYRQVKEKILKQRFNPDGYLQVSINGSKSNPTHKQSKGVHRILSMAFIPNPENKATVNHKDGIKHNNSLDNLEWATHSEQQRHSVKTGLRPVGEDFKSSKLTELEVIDIKKSPLKTVELAEKYGVNHRTISIIKRGSSWKHLNHFLPQKNNKCTAKALLCKVLLDGGVINHKNITALTGYKSLADHIEKNIEDINQWGFGVVLDKKRESFINKKGRKMYYADYKLLKTKENRLGIKRMEGYVELQKKWMRQFTV